MVDSNKNKLTKPEKIINNQDKLRTFINGKTYKLIVSSIELLQTAVEKKKNPFNIEKDVEKSSNIGIIIDFLNAIEKLTSEYPPINQDKQRFGNTAFRLWYEAVEKKYEAEVAPKLNSFFGEDHEFLLSNEIMPYMLECFGNSKRIDYGTGHELNFVCILIILIEVQWLKTEELQKVIQIVFKKYISVCKSIQTIYKLEPAGSKGVYGLDDFHFLSFIFGAAELIENEDGILPSDIQKNLEIVKKLGEDYMFFDAVHYNLKSKNGHLAEHSPILYQISNVPRWEKIAKGLIKMYEDEVLKKIVVAQHFYFGNVLKFE